MTNQALDIVEPARTNRFLSFFRKIGKRNALIACAVVLIGLSVWFNWVLFSGSSDDGYGGYKSASPDVVTSAKVEDNTDSYFSSTQVSRQRARDEALEVLQSVVENVDADDATKTAALADIAVIADEIQKEANIESIITAKGFEQCVAVMSGDTVSVIVKKSELNAADIAQINTAVFEQTGIAPSGVTIIRK